MNFNQVKERKTDSKPPGNFDLLQNVESSAVDGNVLLESLEGSKPSIGGLTKLFSVMRNKDASNLSTYIPQLLDVMKTTILLDSPPSIQFPGDTTSYIQLPSINLLACREAFTLSMWIRLEDNLDGGQPHLKSSLFRCRSPQGGVEGTLSEHQADGRCRLTARVYSESSSHGHRNDQISGTIFLSRNTWHLVTCSQSSMHGISMFKCYVDSNLEMEHELAYPFQQCPSESLWSFGAGLRGNVASVALYGGPEEVPRALVRLHAEAGPHTSSLDTGTSHPQGSFDSGHCLLGTQLTKGHDAARACHTNPIFVFTAKHFTPHCLIPYSSVGKVNIEHIEMVSSFTEPEIDKVPFMAGACVLSTDMSWTQVWVHLGGSSVLLYLIWCYVQLCNAQQQLSCTPSLSAAASAVDPSLKAHMPSSPVVSKQVWFECIHKSMELLEVLLSSSADARDLFLQQHGFHVLAFSLARVQDKVGFVDSDLVDRCFCLVQGLRSDGDVGDGLTAAIQGLLLNFKLWGGADVNTKIYLLNRVSAFMAGASSSHDEVLHRSMGVQRLLDLMKQHCSLDEASRRRAGGREKAMELMDAAHRLLSLALAAALQSLQSMRPSSSSHALFPELQGVLLLLEETRSNEIAERLLRTVAAIRCDYPRVLFRAMQNLRFSETVALHLLCDTSVQFSLEVRRNCLVTVMWSFSELVRDIPSQLLELRQSFRLLHSKSVYGKESNGLMYSGEYAACTTVKQLMKVVEKIWVNINMLMTQLKASLTRNGDWLYDPEQEHFTISTAAGTVSTGTTAVSSAMTGVAVANAGDVVDTALFDGLLGSLSPVVVVPFLAALLPKVQQRVQMDQDSGEEGMGRGLGLEACQRVLMSLSVDLKTNEAQTCLLSLLPDIAWMKHFLAMAVVGETHRRHLQSVVLVRDGAADCCDEDIAGTCTELALDSLAQVIVFKVCYHGAAAWDSILMMQNLLRTEDMVNWEIHLSRRICTLCIQKLSRLSTKQWPGECMKTISNLILMIEDNQYCCNELVINKRHDQYAMRTSISCMSTDIRADECVDLLGLETADEVPQTPVKSNGEEDHLLFFLFDFTASLRRAGERQGASRAEMHVILPVMRILMGCFARASDETGDRLCVELLANISYMAEHCNFFEEEGLWRIVTGVLAQLQGARACQRQRHTSAVEPSKLLKRYSDLVVTIAQFFVQLRFVYSDGLPLHVVSTVERLSLVEGCNDADTILEVLHIRPSSPSSIIMNSKSGSRASLWAEGSPGLPSPSVISFTDEDDDVVKVSTSSISQEEGVSKESTNEVRPQQQQQEQMAQRRTSQLAQIEHEEEQQRKYLARWLKVRRGISQERVDSEQARFQRALEGVDFSEEATARFWELLSRKLEAEVFADEHACEWKLGVAHEGYFPSRKRLVLRPRFVANNQIRATKKKLRTEEPTPLPIDASMSAEQLQALLTATSQQPGVLVDVHQHAAERDDEEEIAGTGFCVVGADDSEDGGYGVVGLAGAGSGKDKGDGKSPSGESKAQGDEDDQEEQRSAAVDDVSDMDVNTGPCYSGTRRFIGKDNSDSGNTTVHEADVVLISASGNHVGHMAFSSLEIFFVSTPTAHLSWEGEGKGGGGKHPADVEVGHLEDGAAVTLEAHRKTRRRKWSVSAISAIYLRRYRLRDTSIEVFFGRGKHRNFFVDFGSSEEDVGRRNEFVKILMETAPQSALKEWPGMSLHRLLNEHGVQQRWLDGELSNFDYLMALNTIAGRSFNDICQYPVFPWVLSQYTEATIDLSNPKNYRDLSKPMGALNEERLQQFVERWDSFRDSDLPPFMYGSHYSTMVGVVLHFFVRLQPFASLHKKMQGGGFDVADRLFASIPRTWEHNTTMLSEVKELTPEFYSMPDFLRNINNYDLGRTQSKEQVQDVELPPWASSPEEFIRINREALESDFVSEHLHEWIDLIFGYKQRGPRALEAHNVFYYLTYYGAVNRSLIKDEATKKAIELQIAHFGQCPMEIFRYPHPQKVKKSVPRPLRRCFDGKARSFVKPTCPEEELSVAASCTLVNRLSSARIVDMIVKPGAVVCILDNGVLEAYRFAMSDTAKYIISNRKRDQAKENGISTNSSSSSSNRSGNNNVVNGGNIGMFDVDNGLGNLISFDDANEPALDGGDSGYGDVGGGIDMSLVEELEGRAAGYSTNAVSMVDTPPPKAKSRQRRPSKLGAANGSGDGIRDVLIAVEKEFLHFDQIQRVPISRIQTWNRRPAQHAMVTPQVHCSHSSGLIFCYGRVDGGVAVRQLASKQAHVLLGGDFRGHLYPVCGLASDEITGGSTDVVCSCDVGGKVLVWTVSRVTSHQHHARASSSGTASTGPHKCIISRRPQRQFQCSETSHMCCDISWHMGVVAASHDAHVSIFSIERNERFTSFEVNAEDLWAHCPSARPISFLGGDEDVGVVVIRHINLSDDGFILLALTVSDQSAVRHVLATYSIRGQCVMSSPGEGGGNMTAVAGSPCITSVTSPITFLAVPSRGSVAISGHEDGKVVFFDVRNLQLLYEFRPHDHSLTCIFSSVGGPSSGSGGMDRSGVVTPSPEQAPILAVRVGPSSALPAVVCVTTASGGFYVCALPDFVRWDKIRSQSTLAQLANVPMQVVRGSLQQAQNLSILASDNAGQFALNAKSYADDAFAKINKSKLVKNVFGMFGSGAK